MFVTNEKQGFKIFQLVNRTFLNFKHNYCSLSLHKTKAKNFEVLSTLRGGWVEDDG